MQILAPQCSLNIYDVQYFISVSLRKTFEQRINKHCLNGIVYTYSHIHRHTTFIPTSRKERTELNLTSDTSRY